MKEMKQKPTPKNFAEAVLRGGLSNGNGKHIYTALSPNRVRVMTTWNMEGGYKEPGVPLGRCVFSGVLTCTKFKPAA